ncbi:hypothetical protein DLI08_08720 [Vibrio parahaemolyticus]|nr:hypothetical protein [Vibrio parahaemolyticus]EGX6073671.1 hypothetical protein [Vibrio parahaemolyticus]
MTAVAVGLMAYVTGSNPEKMLSAVVSWPVYVSSLYLLIQSMAIALLINLLNFHQKIRQLVGILISIFYGMFVTVIVADIMTNPEKIKSGLVTILITFICVAIFDVLPKIKEHIETPTKMKWIKIDKTCHVIAVTLAIAANICVVYKLYNDGIPLIATLYT